MKLFTQPIRTFLFAGLFALAASVSALAGPQYVDKTGFAASGYDVVAYRGLNQAPIGQAQPRAVPGSSNYTAEWNGAKWAFSSAANRDKFVAEPAKYAPAFDGHCAYGISKGGKVPANPNLWRIVDGQLYLNITPKIVEFWTSDIPGNLKKAGTNWGKLESKAASTNPVPKFDISLAPKG